MTTTTPEHSSRPHGVSMPFKSNSNDDFFSEFVDLGPEDSSSFGSLPDLPETMLNSLLLPAFDNAMNNSGAQLSASGPDWPRAWLDDLEPATVTLSQLNLPMVDKTYHMQFDLREESQQPSVSPFAHQRPREDGPQQQQRILPALAPQNRRERTDLQHCHDDKTPRRAETVKRRTRPYPEEDVTCRQCNVKTTTPGELR